MKKKLKNPPLKTETIAAPVDGLSLATWTWFGVGAIIAAFLAYAAVLHGPFVFDDLSGIYLFPNAAKLPLAQWIGITRPLTLFSFWINYQLDGTDPAGYHWVNLLLHLASAFFVTLIVRKLLRESGTAGFGSDVLGAFAGLVFLLHPLQTEAVSYVSSRSEVLAVSLLWAAFGHFLYRKNRAASWYDAIVIIALFGMACLAKEYSVVFPLLLLLADYYWNPGFTIAGLRGNWRIYSLLAAGALAGGLFILRVLNLADTAGFKLKDLTVADYFFTQCRVIWFYVLKFIIPFGQTIDYDFSVSRSLMDGGAIFGLLGLLVATAAAILYRKRFPLASYGWLVFLILLAPTSSFLPIRDLMVERRVYLPMIGLLLIAIEFLRRIEWNHAKMAVLGVIVLAFGFVTAQRNEVWSSPGALWRDTVAKAPAKSRGHFQLGRIYYGEGNYEGAAAEYETAARTADPKDWTLLLNWGLALDDAGHTKEALAKFFQAAQIHPSAHLFSQIARCYGRSGDNEKALQALAMAEQMDPSFEMIYVYRGNVYLTQGDSTRAAAEYNRALAINSNNGLALQGLRNAAKNRR